jgi:hypothetical protein
MNSTGLHVTDMAGCRRWWRLLKMLCLSPEKANVDQPTRPDFRITDFEVYRVGPGQRN